MANHNVNANDSFLSCITVTKMIEQYRSQLKKKMRKAEVTAYVEYCLIL